MDLATIIGLGCAFGLVVLAMLLGGDIMIFINVQSVLIVFGGAVCVAMMKFSLGQFLKGLGIAGKAFKYKIESPVEIIEQSINLAQAARKGGLLSLEEMKVDNEFMAKGVQFLVDGIDPEVLKSLLRKEVAESVDRHEWGQKIFTSIGDVGPAMGMIGTLIGLVQMLSAMDDPKSIGPAMAVALLTTLYGAILATMLSLPLADKLVLRAAEEEKNMNLIIDALLAIQAGQNPRVIKDLLYSYVPPSQRPEEEED